METFGERLRKWRMKLNLSLDELAAKTGVSKPYLWRLETNPDVNPSIEVAQRLAAGLGISVTLLIAAESATEDENVEIPPTLKQAQARIEIPEQDLLDLARIRFRGAQPMTADDWILLYLQLKKTISE